MAKKENPELRSDPVISRFVGLIFEFLKHIINHFELQRSAKKSERLQEQISELENLIIKLDHKSVENSRHLDAIRNKLTWSYVLNILTLALLITTLFQVVHY